MKYLKGFFVLALLLIPIPIAFGELQITLPEKDFYNLGEKIAPSISIKEDLDYDGFFKLYLSCSSYSLQYYTIPLNIEADSRTQITVPDLALSKSMVGECSLKSDFESVDGSAIDSGQSRSFLITDGARILINDGFEAKPGEKVGLLGDVQKLSNETLLRGDAEIAFNGEKNYVNISNGKFDYTIELSKDSDTGDFPVKISVTDKYGNHGEKTLNLRILPIPTRIENRFDNNIILPGETLRARVTLYDHINRVMNGTKLNVRAFTPSENLITEKEIQNQDYFELKTEKKQAPGTYLLLSRFEDAKFGDVKEQSSFIVEAVKKIAMKQEGDIVNVENAGNVIYDEEVTIVLEKDGKKYVINKKIKLGSGEKIAIDLSKEVPQGNYDIILPKDAATNESSTVNKTENISAAAENVLKNVSIDDNRPALKKTIDGIFAITGAVVGAAGYVASRPALATTILVLIILGTVLHYSWGFIKSKVNRRRNDESHLFKDFRYENEDNKPRN